MKLSKRIIAIPAIALAAGLGLAACGSGSGSGPALTAGSATAHQICHAVVGMKVTNTLTGQDTGTTVVSESSESLPGGQAPNASGNEVAYCSLTMDTGAGMGATVTLFANGSIGFHGGELPPCPYTNCG